MLKTNMITKDVQMHLSRVYTTLACTILMAAFGTFVDIQLHLGGLLSTLASVGFLMGLQMNSESSVNTRLSYLMAFAFCNGLNIGSLVFYALQVDPTLLVTAGLGTTMIFLCFSLTALVAKRREYLFLGGILSSGLSIMMLLSIFSFFVKSDALSSVHLVIYFSILVLVIMFTYCFFV